MTDVIISDTKSAYRQAYHTKPDCEQLCDETQTITQEKANRMGLDLCGHCDGIDRGDNDFSMYENAKARGTQ